MWAARDEIAPEGMDVVVGTVGHPRTLEATNRLVRPGGRIVAVGYSPTTDLSLPTSRLVLDELEVVGSRFARRGDLERAIALVASGDVKPIVGLVRGLDEVNDAFSILLSGEVVGRAVLDIAGVQS
jgi:acryloyl-coenzyme A reductase